MQPASDDLTVQVVPPGLLLVRSGLERGVLVITLTGEADISGEHVLDEALDSAHTHAGPVVVDLTELTFCDVRSLTSLLASHAVALTRGAGVALVGMSELMIRVWTIAFEANIPMERQPARYRTVAEAVAAANSASLAVTPLGGRQAG